MLKGIIITMLFCCIFFPAFTVEDITVGDFIQRLANSLGYHDTGIISATDALKANGIHISPDLDFKSLLTEQDVVTLARAAGLNVITSHPDRLFNKNQLERFFQAFAIELAGINQNYPINFPVNRFTKGKGKGKGKSAQTEVSPN